LEERVEALEYPVGDTVFRPVDYVGSMPLESPGHLDDLSNPAVDDTGDQPDDMLFIFLLQST